MLGFLSVPFDREKRYSLESYRGLYRLTEEEAREVTDTYHSHPAIDLHLSQRYISDPDYRRRIDEACADITATEADDEVRRIMERSDSYVGEKERAS